VFKFFWGGGNTYDRSDVISLHRIKIISLQSSSSVHVCACIYICILKTQQSSRSFSRVNVPGSYRHASRTLLCWLNQISLIAVLPPYTKALMTRWTVRFEGCAAALGSARYVVRRLRSIHIYVCLQTRGRYRCKYGYTNTYMYICIHLSIYLYLYIYIHTYTFIYICTHIYLYIYIYEVICIYTCIHI